MKKKKSNLPKWKYDFSCKKCRHIQYVKDKVKRRDGGKHKAVEIVADSVYFADAKKESAAGSYAESAMTSEGFEVTDEDIPF